MEPYQQRVLDERAQLKERVDKLDAYLRTTVAGMLDYADWRLLRLQLTHMEQYLGVLDERIKRWKYLAPAGPPA